MSRQTALAKGPLGRAKTRLKNIVRPNVTVTPPPEGVMVDRDVAVTVRDGAVLRANVYRPADDGAYPVIMSAHPYGKDYLPKPTRKGYRPFPNLRILPQSQPFSFSAWTGWEAPDPAYWVPRGYVVVNADLRGWGTSEGTGVLLGPQEGEDYHDLIEWAGVQPWSTGMVGLSGVSYLALSQWAAAATHPPHLAAISPWEGFTDFYRDVAMPGGVREDGLLIVWTKGTAHTRKDSDVDLRRQQITRPVYDEWWAARDREIEKIDVPALICASFSDHNLHTRGSFEGFRRIASRQKWLYTHRGPKWAVYYGDEALAEQTRFFDHFLKGQDNGQGDVPPVRLEVREDADTVTSVRREQQWPPARTQWQAWYLQPDGGFGDAPMSPATVSFHTRRGSVRFTHRFQEDTEIVGPMTLRLSLEVEGTDDVCVFAGVRKLRRGKPVAFENAFGFRGSLITDGIRRASHRRVDESGRHPEDVTELLSPGQVVSVRIELLPSATLFRAGDELQLQIQGRWFYARNPFTGQFPSYFEKSRPGRCVVHVGADHPTVLEVPVQPPTTVT
ncbi:CocE/NonD family hydrolase [Phytoactinopolyspora halotolerans]|uniref:CocE/NonD family hydrolase n=1 Tax=Phytoactinopolyspora halotolerans TaxID=1981512 RepID=A0A6L9S2V4_9ACTN|nr:CocE/NonD family hydrolase [Phytoactinopolyspora halotolerans]NED99150.1 CocE/NonD family hydrolase [Phytoactinopolyspora halotolerans]